MSNVFFPYRYFNEVLSVEITKLIIDREDKSNYIDYENQCIGLENVKDWNELECQIKVNVPDGIPAKISSDTLLEDWKAVLIVKSMAGSGRQIGWRRIVQLSTLNMTRQIWKGKLKLFRSDEGSWVHIQAFLTRNKEIVSSNDNLAYMQGQRLASSKSWSINIDEHSSPLGKSIRIEWINFREDPRFEQFPLNIYQIDFSESLPVLYLNEAINDLKVVLSSKGYKGTKAAVRESIFRSIAQPVWLSLLLSAIKDEYPDEDDRPEWQKSVITQFAPIIAPDIVDEEAAVQELVRLAENPDILLPKLISAIQSSIEIERSTTRLLNIIIQK